MPDQQKQIVGSIQTNLKGQREAITKGAIRHRIDAYLNFDTMDLDFYGDFTTYLTKKESLAVNSVGKYIQTPNDSQ